MVHETLNVKPKDMEKHWLVTWAVKNGIKTHPCMLPQPRDMPGWMINEARRQGGGVGGELDAGEQHPRHGREAGQGVAGEDHDAQGRGAGGARQICLPFTWSR